MRKGCRLIGLLTVLVAVSLAYADDYVDDVYYWQTKTKTETQTETQTQTQTKTTTKTKTETQTKTKTETKTQTQTTTKTDEDVETWDAEYVQVQDTVVKLVIHR